MSGIGIDAYSFDDSADLHGRLKLQQQSVGKT